MTTFQDPPPQSRRAVRQSERGEPNSSPDSPTGFAQFPPVQVTPAAYTQPANHTSAPYFPDATAARDLWDTTARRAAQLPQPPAGSSASHAQAPAQTPAQGAQAAQSGRRAAGAQAQPAAAPPFGEPLSYATQAPLPTQAFAAPQVPLAAQAPVAPPAQPQQQYTAQQYTAQQQAWQQPYGQPQAAAAAPSSRPRQEARRAQESAAQAGPQQAAAQQAAAQQAAAHEVAAQQALAQQQYAAQVAAAQQLAAQQAAAQQAAPAQPAYRPRDFSPEGRRSTQSEQPSWTLASPATPSELEYQTQARGAFDQYQQFSSSGLQQPGLQQPVAQQYLAQQPVAQQFQAQQFPGQAVPSYAPSQPVQQTLSRRELRALLEQQGGSALSNPETHLDALGVSSGYASGSFDAASSHGGLRDTAPATGTRPVGHWSTLADQDDPNEVYETTLSRVVGSGHTATNALVLPAAPSLDIRGPLTGTGEIMLTGSIELPRNLASTGATDRIDHGGIDALFDANDREVSMADSAPIRAMSAVSTHTSARGIQMHKPKGRGVMTLLLVAAGIMVVGVAGLLVAAFVFKLI